MYNPDEFYPIIWKENNGDTVTGLEERQQNFEKYVT